MWIVHSHYPRKKTAQNRFQSVRGRMSITVTDQPLVKGYFWDLQPQNKMLIDKVHGVR